MSIDNIKKALDLASGIDFKPLPRIPTGILSLDLVLGGGFPVKRISEIYGWSLTGKTYLMLRVARIFLDLKETNIVLWFDREGALEPQHLESFNMDTERFIWVPPSKCFTVDDLENLFKSAFDTKSEEDDIMVVVDSVGAYVKDIKAVEKTKADMGRVAKGIKDFLRKATGYLDDSESSFLLLANHLYMDPQAMVATTKKSGGTGLDYLRTCGLCLQVTKEGDIKNPDTNGYFLYGIAEKTRLIKGDKPDKTCVFMDKRGYGIHPLSGIAYYLACWNKLEPTNKKTFSRPSYGEVPSFKIPNIEKNVKFTENNLDRVYNILNEYSEEIGLDGEFLEKLDFYIENYNFHED